ncbi:trigger factor [Solicola gregarius]|uniref:Trigger factor n=1 Tax=Solicola gregarius TaxID=2908642 RepID=A0AA46TFH9_9ACTN|nr:trigger factor [Solicola gregarius]UYM04285.1 trigger factor [Solicola gregarius]
MKSATETLSPTRVKLTVEVPFEELKPSLDAAYKQIGQQINIPGFRRGKVPPQIVDQRVGRESVLNEAVNDALPGLYGKALEEHELQPLGQPEVDLTKLEYGETLEFTAELDVRPEIELPTYDDLSVTVEDAEVSDDDVQEQIDGLRERFATYQTVERAVADGDYVTIDLSASKDGEKIEAAQAEGMSYQVGTGEMLDGLDEALTGLSAGESATFDTELVGGELKGQDVQVEVSVTEVKEQELPEFDDEFAQEASQFDTADELRADLHERVVRGKRMEQASEARDLVLEELLERVDIPLPEGVVEEEINGRREQITEQLTYAGITMDDYLESEEQTADEFEADLEKRVRDALAAQFLLDEISRKAEIGIEESELTEHILRRAQQSGADPQQYAQHMMEHNHVPQMVSEVIRGKALAQIVEDATVTDKSGNAVDLKRLQADGTLADDDDDETAETADDEEPSVDAAASI